MCKQSTTEFLTGTHLCEGLSACAVAKIAAICTERTYRAGTAIINEGSPDPFVGVIRSGKCSVKKGSRRFDTAHTGDLIGVVPLFDYGPHVATVCAAGACRVLEFDPVTGLEDLMTRDRRVWANMGRIMGMKYRRLMEQIEPLDERIVGTIARLLRANHARYLVMTTQELAEEVGATRERVGKRLQSLLIEGAIERRRGTITVEREGFFHRYLQ